MSGPVNQKFMLLVLALCTAFVGTFGCSSRLNPQKTFDHAQQLLVRGNLPSAETEAHTAYERLSSNDQEWAWKFRLLDAEILVVQGHSEDARSTLNATLPQRFASSDLAIKQKLLLGSAYIPLGRLADAEQNLRSAQELCDALQSPLAGEVARAWGLLERTRSHPEIAARFFRQSLQLARQRHDAHLEMTDLLNLGVLAEQQEHYDESIDWSNAAYRAAQVVGDTHASALVVGNLGFAYYKMGDFDRSLALYQDAEKKASELGAVYYQILWMNNIGWVYYQKNQLPVAEDYYRRSLALAQKNDNPEQIIDALTELAFVSVQKGQLAEAQQYGQQAFQLAHARKDRAAELYPILVEGQISASRGDYQTAETKFREVAADSQSDLSLRWQSQNDLARLYERQHRLADADKQYREALATIEQARSSLQREDFRLPFLANAAHLYDDYIRFLVAQGKNSQALQLADYSRARTLAEGLGVVPGKSATVSAELNAQQLARQSNATILFYWLGQEQSYLWTITAHNITLSPLPPAAEIDTAVQHYRQALLGWQDVLETANQAGSHLYEVLLRPAGKIAPNSRVIVISDGSLDSLNFETLLVPEPRMHYWIEEATVLSASSLRVLAASQVHRKNATGRLLLIGDAAVSTPEYAPLPNARLEIENVGKHFAAQAQRVFTGDRATPAAYLKNDPGQFSFIHFVAHATASKLSPLDSAIVLSPISAESDSFKLYARDITQHPLFADVVTISSCYGAGSTAYSGEGLVGLSWAFLRAGAHNVIGALWEVSDASTARLMDKLYGELKRGQPPEAALRTAKLSLLHSDEVFRKPFYWAPFQLYTGR